MKSYISTVIEQHQNLYYALFLHVLHILQDESFCSVCLTDLKQHYQLLQMT